MLLAGVDEVGRGPLAGPVMAAAVILPSDWVLSGVKDSKQLTPAAREKFFAVIAKEALNYAFGEASQEEIDELNIHVATLLAMQRAIAGLKIRPDHVLVDGRFCPQVDLPIQAIINGDETELCISSASIMAKVSRDRLMLQYDKEYPQYGFAQHKGYGTPQHIGALKKYGPTPIHRRSFAPVKQLFFSEK